MKKKEGGGRGGLQPVWSELLFMHNFLDPLELSLTLILTTLTKFISSID